MRIIRRAFIPLFQSYRRNRNRYAREIQASLAWSADEAMAVHREKLAETLRYCLKEIPFYKSQVDLDPEKITADNAEDCLLAFPVLTSSMVKEHFDDLQCSPRPDSAFLNRSGGTTGTPTTFYLDQESEDWVRGTKRYHMRAAGVEVGEKRWVIWGSPEEYQRKRRTRKARIASWISNAERICGFSLSEAELDLLLERMLTNPPKFILAYVDILDRLAARAEETNRDMPKTIKMMVTAGTLYVPIRARIERVFGPSLYDCYGSREFGDLALSCDEKEGLHIVGLSHYIEVADETGARLPDGESGEFLVTSMVNRTMPLVRYAIKDYGSMTREACGCDNPWHRILSLEGRKQDLFYAPDGRKISPNAMVHFCWAYGMEYATQVQMVQRDVDHLEVHLLKIEKEKPRDEAFEAKMRWELETLFRVPLTIDICWKEEMAVTPTGKYRMIQRQMKETDTNESTH